MGNCCGDPVPDYDESDGEHKRNPRTLRRNVCCTDIVVLIIFFAFWTFLAFIAITSLIRGDARRVIYGYDTSGNTCNQRNSPIPNLTDSGRDTIGRKNVFFMSTLYPKQAVQICVEKCPDKKMTTKNDVIDFYQRTGVSLCRYGVIPQEKLEFSRLGPCPELPIYKSIVLMSRCIPDPVSIMNETSKKNITSKFAEIFHLDEILPRVLNDLSACWKELIGLAFIAVVTAFLMVLMMRFLAFVIVWLIVVLAIIGSIVGTSFLWWCFAVHVRKEKEETEEFLIPLVGSSIKKKNAFLLFAIIATILTVILLLVLFIMRKRISLVVALFHEAGKCLAEIPFLLIQPLWTFIIYATVTLYFIFIYACISTMGTAISRQKYGFEKVKFEKSTFEKQFWWIHLIGWIWTSEFILACQEFIITSSVTIWYFSSNKKALGFSILKSIALLIMHHMGSIAFGSLIITIVKVIRYILMYIESKCKGQENACARCCLKCCICCLWCLEKFLKFLHQNAYTIIAIEGTNFCTSARKAFEIISCNALRVIAINSVGDFVLFLGKVGVMCICGGFAVLWIRTVPDVQFLAVPVLLVCIFSFLIAHCFLSVYEMVVDALLICFCLDCERNDGTPGREYFMSQSLMKFVTNSSAHIEKLNSRGKDAGDTVESTGLNPTN